MAELAEQHREIDRAEPEVSRRFRLLKGIEANIRADGTRRHGADELAAARDRRRRAAFGAAVDDRSDRAHGGRGQTRGVHILGHPRGRMYGSRPGVSADWDAVFEAAARCGRRDRDRRRSRRGRISTTTSRAARSTPAASSRSTATRTRPASCATPKPPSRTRGWPAFPPIASSTAGRSSGCSNGPWSGN